MPSRYPDPLTEIEVYRLTFPDYSSTLTAYYNRGIAHNSGWMLVRQRPHGFAAGFPPGFEIRRDEADDAGRGAGRPTLTLLPDNRSFCYLAGRGCTIPSFPT